MKKKITFFILLFITFTCFNFFITNKTVKAASEFEIDGTTLISYNGAASKVVIPSNITIIGDGAFEYNEQLVEVVLHDKVTQIGIRAFNNCRNLSAINIEKVTKIGEMSFQGTSIREVTFPDAITDIPIGTFAYSKIEEVTLSKNALSIASSAFYKCSNLKKITLSDSLYSIGDQAFLGCINLTSINLPNNLEIVGVKSFSESGLTEITFPGTVLEVSANVCANCASLAKVTFNEGTTKIGSSAFINTIIKEVTIPSTVEEIGIFAFNQIDTLERIDVLSTSDYLVSDNGILYSKDYETLIKIPENYRDKTINIHDGIKYTLERSASELNNVTKIVIPEGLEIIDHNTFAYSTRLEEVILPDSLRIINSGAFNTCEALLKIKLPEGLKEISSTEWWLGVFAYCSSLEEVVLPDSLEKLGPYTFNDCLNLKKVVIPSGLIDYGVKQFVNCPSLEEIVVKEGNPFAYTIDGIYYETRDGVNALSVYPSNLPLEEYTIPSDVKIIDGYAFSSSKNLKKVIIPETVESFGPALFQNSTSIEEVIIESKITTLPQMTFHNSTIKKVTLPNTLEVIDLGAFNLCKNLENIDLPYGLKTIVGAAFNGSGLKTIVLPDSVISIDQAFMNCNKLESVTLSNSLRDIGPSCFRESKITKIVIPESMVEIPDYAFCACFDLTTVYLPKTVSYFNQKAFSGCGKLTDIIVDEENPYIKMENGLLYNEDYSELLFVNRSSVGEIVEIKNGVKSISQETFMNIENIKEITIPATVESYGYMAFDNASFEKVIFEDGTKIIPSSLFRNNRKLKEVIIPDSVEKIESGVFLGCISLTSFTLPDSVNIDEGFSLFADCVNLREIKLPSHTKKIPQYMFENCISLTEVVIPNSVERIETNCFAGCIGIKSLVLPENVSSLEFDAFANSGIKDLVILGNAPILVVSTFGNTYFPKDMNIYYSKYATGFTSSTYRDYVKQLIEINDFTFNDLIDVEIIDSGDHLVQINAKTIFADTYTLYVTTSGEKVMYEENQTGSFTYLVTGGKTYEFTIEVSSSDYLKNNIIYKSVISKQITFNKNHDEYKLEYVLELIESYQNINVGFEELAYLNELVTDLTADQKDYLKTLELYQELNSKYEEEKDYLEDINKIEWIKVNNKEVTHHINDEFNLDVIFNTDVKNQTLSYYVVDDTIARVDEFGHVTCLKEGSTKIYVKALNGVETYYILEVKAKSMVAPIIIISICAVVAIGTIGFIIIKKGGKKNA